MEREEHSSSVLSPDVEHNYDYSTHCPSTRKLRVTFLASEWGSSKGGLSTINRELAINIAKDSEVEVKFFVPRCNDEDKKAAQSHNIELVKAVRRPGLDELEWLNFPSYDLQIDVVVGHGVKLGHQAQVIRESHKCKWVQVVHTAPEELGMYKAYSDPILNAQKKHETEVELCELADFVVTVGPKLCEAFRTYLRSCKKDKYVFEFTPGILGEFSELTQVLEERKTFRILCFGRGDSEDFSLKGFDIAAQAVAELTDCHLLFVGAADDMLEETKNRFLECGISPSKLTLRSFLHSRECLKKVLCEADLAVMPSRTEGFGLTGLEALSAGLPILVSRKSGLGEALMKIPFGSLFVIDSVDPEVWAKAIKNVCSKERSSRLQECKILRVLYQEKYSWKKQSKSLIGKMISITDDPCGACQSSPRRTTLPQKEEVSTSPNTDPSGACQSSTRKPTLPQKEEVGTSPQTDNATDLNIAEGGRRRLSLDTHLGRPEPFQSMPAQELLKDNCRKYGSIRREGENINTYNATDLNIAEGGRRRLSLDTHLGRPEPFQSMPAEELLKDNCRKYGWLRREGGNINRCRRPEQFLTDLAQQENNGFGPISKPRGKAATITTVIVVVISVVMLMFAVKEKEKKEGIHFLVFTAALLTLSLVLGELVRRLCLVSEEIQHKYTRYQGNWKRVLKSTFSFEYGGCILVAAIASALTLCYLLYEHYEVFSRPDYAILFSLNCFVVPQLLFLVGLRQLSVVETSALNERENKNVADGLAWSYYFGYLKLVLPRLEGQITKSEEFRFKIKEKKLFILLPKTCFTYVDIANADSRVKWAGNLPESRISRGGVKERIYKHTVYRIATPLPDRTVKNYHFVLEYATPLMSLYDMSEHADAVFSRQERDHQVVLFIRKLREILDNCEECRGKYELVLISGNDRNKIADVLVGMHNAANIELDNGADD